MELASLDKEDKNYSKEDEDAKFLYHEPCEACGSSRTPAKAVYSNGSAYCFSCGTWFPPDDNSSYSGRDRKTEMSDIKLLTNIKYKRLNARKIDEETCRKFGYGYGKYKGDIVQVAPYHNENGKIIAQHLRTKQKDFSWVGDTDQIQLFGQQLWNRGKRLVITEGEVDAMTVAQIFNLNWAVVSVPNGATSAKKYIKQNMEFISGFDEVVFAFDNDEDGRNATKKCAPLLEAGKAKVANWSPYNDANEMMVNGKAQEIAQVIFNAKEFRPDGIIAGSELSVEYLKSEEDIDGYEMPYPKLSGMMRDLRMGELTTVVAGTGAGKSTLAREIAFNLVSEHDLNIGHIALEESTKKSALGFMAMDLGVPLGDLFLDKSIVDDDEFEEAHERLIDENNIYFYDHFGSLEADALMNKMKFLATGLDVDFIVLDHLSIVVSGISEGNERRTIDNLMTNLRSIVEHSGVGMILVSHLRVPQGQKEAHEEGGRVTLNQIRGSGSIKQLSDNIIAIERDQQADEDPNLSQIRLLKCRLFGETGVADVCRYNPVTGRLKATDEEYKNQNEGGSSYDFQSEEF